MSEELATIGNHTRRGFSRRTVVRTAAWSAPAITVVTAAPAFAYPSAATISVTSAHDYRSTQTAGQAVFSTTADASSNASGACKPASGQLDIVLRITNTDSTNTVGSLSIVIAAAAGTIAPGTLETTGTWSSPSEPGASLVFTYIGTPVPPLGSVDFVARLSEIATGDQPLTVSVGGDVTAPAVGLYGAPNFANFTAFGVSVSNSSVYPGSNGSSFAVDTSLRIAYPTHYKAFVYQAPSTSAIDLVSSPQTLDFNGIGSGLPSGVSVRTGSTANAVGTAAAFTSTTTSWTSSGGGFVNCASAAGLLSSSDAATQASSTDRVPAVRQTGSFGDPGAGFVFKIANTTGKSNLKVSVDLMSLGPVTSTIARTTTWILDYGIGENPTSFTSTGVTATTANGAFTTSTLMHNFSPALDNLPSPVWIRVVALTSSSGSGSRAMTGVDNLTLTWS